MFLIYLFLLLLCNLTFYLFNTSLFYVKLCSLIIAINLCDFPRNELMNSFQQLISHMNGYSFIMIVFHD